MAWPDTLIATEPDFHCAAKIIAGIETMHMIRKGQSAGPEPQVMSAAELFYDLAF